MICRNAMTWEWLLSQLAFILTISLHTRHCEVKVLSVGSTTEGHLALSCRCLDMAHIDIQTRFLSKLCSTHQTG